MDGTGVDLKSSKIKSVASDVSLDLEKGYDELYGRSSSSLTNTGSDCTVGKSKKERNNRAEKNRTFTSYQIREIENDNSVLMKKVLNQSKRPKQYTTTTNPIVKISSAEVNRRKLQKKIDHENLVSSKRACRNIFNASLFQILLKRIQSIKPFGLSKVQKSSTKAN